MSLIARPQSVIRSLGIIESPVYPRASSTCKLKFWFVKYGIAGSFNAAVFSTSTNQKLGDLYKHPSSQVLNWTEVDISIGSIYVPFKLVFEATKSFNQKGVISLDDIELENCALPFASDSIVCSLNQTKCLRGNCVNNDRLCDFVDDCGDFTDESLKTCASYQK